MLKNQVETILPTEWGNFRMIAYSENEEDWMPHLALIHENTDFEKPVPIRLHSECLTGDIFHSTKCECGKQLHQSLAYFQENGGILLYLRQEGRNIGLINKMKAYNLQKNGKNTVEANLALGLPADGRNFEEAIQILEDLQLKSILLLTNNPEKLVAFEQSSIQLIGRIPIEIKASVHNQNYLETKKNVFQPYFRTIKCS
ncbi:GTP cyclohydrolase II [Flavobacterium piscinae]|uniref:GTP cyclohydrolase II n=1 Tax=Flavobacterium piscinae TaxID=2506424 RepID=UPI0019861AAC|nr:GTP cyclohydrolase II [Flavobacterium piscinae]MBC8883490.1 GTP cyclohydrolase II [Flavobacterium piscinae]